MRVDAGLLLGARPLAGARDARWTQAQRGLDKDTDLREVAREFESLLLEQMMRTMREATPKADLFNKDRGQELFRELLDGEYMRLFTKRGGIGLSDYLVRYMEKYQ